MNPQDQPNALKESDEQQRRVAMLSQPHIAPLQKYLLHIRAEHPGKEIPNCDPCDGGMQAKALFLLEAPGPKAILSGFISRNNPDPTARNIFNLWQEAGISRTDTLIWNIVPWYVDDGKRIKRDDIRQLFPYVKDLLSLLPNLKVVGLVGKKAQFAKDQISQLTPSPIIDMPHPSAQNLNTHKDQKDEMRKQLRRIADIINGD